MNGRRARIFLSCSKSLSAIEPVNLVSLSLSRAVVFIRLTTRRGLEMSISMYTSSNGNKKVMNYHKRFMREMVMCHYMARKELARERERCQEQKRTKRREIICYLKSVPFLASHIMKMCKKNKRRRVAWPGESSLNR